MSKNLSHAACNHPSTKVARAKCRRELARLVTTVVAVASIATDSPIITAWESMKSGPLELLAAPARTAVTSENWREFKGQSVTVDFYGVTSVGEITGWSEKNIQIKSTDEMGKSKTQRFPSAHVLSASVTA